MGIQQNVTTTGEIPGTRLRLQPNNRSTPLDVLVGPENTLQNSGGFPAARLLGMRSGVNGEFSANSNFTNTNFFALVQTRHILPYGADAIQLVYAGWAKPLVSSSVQETTILPAVWRCAAGTLVAGTGGTGYAVDDTITGPSGTTTPTPWLARVVAVSSGAVTKLQIIRGGIYTGASPPADGMVQSGTSGSGSGATFNSQWDGFAGAIHLSITPVFATPVLVGPGALELASQQSQGNYSDLTQSWDCYIPSGGELVTDVIPVDIPPGQAIGIRGEIIGANLQCGRPVNYPGSTEFCANGPSFFERANTTTSLGTSAANQLCQPAAIIGIPKVVGPSVLIIGDSRLMYIGAGTDVMDANGNWGWMERALAALAPPTPYPNGIPNTQFGRSQDKLANFINITVPAVGRNGLRRAIEQFHPTACYINLSINDFVAGTTAATVLQWETQMVSFLRGEGIQQVVTDTTDPNTNSTDSWATLVNQTITGAGAQAQIRNQNLRGGVYAGIYDLIIDQQGITEYNGGGSPSGLWIPNETTDGIHANQTTLIAKATHAQPILANFLVVS